VGAHGYAPGGYVAVVGVEASPNEPCAGETEFLCRRLVVDESQIVAVGDAVIGDVLADSAVVMTEVVEAPKKARNGSGKLNKKALAGYLALPFVERLGESDRGMFEMMIASANADKADEVAAYFEPKARAERAVTGGVGSRAPRAFQAPAVEGVDLHKIYRAELVGLWIVGRANTAGGWLARNLQTGEQFNTEIQKVAGRDVAKAHAEANSPKGGKAIVAAKEAFAARTAADPKYGMVADGKLAGTAKAIWNAAEKKAEEIAAG